MWLVLCSFLLQFRSRFKSCDVSVLFSGHSLEPCSALVLSIWLQKAEVCLSLVPGLLGSFCDGHYGPVFHVAMFFCPSEACIIHVSCSQPISLKLCVDVYSSDDWPQGPGGEQWWWTNILRVKVGSWCSCGNSKPNGEAKVYGWREGLFSWGAFQ